MLDRQDTVERLRPLTATAGVDGVVAVQTIGSEAETERLLALADADPLIAGVVGWVDLEAADVAARLDRLLAGAGGGWLVGIRTMLSAGDDVVPGPRLVDGMRALANRGLALDLLLNPSGLPAALAVAAAAPQLRIVVDHLAKPRIETDALHDWASGMRTLSECGNVAVKLSGLLTQLSHGEGSDALLPCVGVALDAFGARRAMIGSDWPLCEPVGGYQRAIGSMERLAAECTRDVDPLRAGTAVEWYRLAAPAGRAS
ncbi:amidohydrolase family protein [Humibacter antri]